MFDMLGNFLFEGSGGEYDLFGNLISPPDSFVDLFIVDLDSGLAWVDFGEPTIFNSPIRWGFSDSDDAFTIKAVPEPSTGVLSMLALAMVTIKRGNRCSSKKR